MQPCTPLAVSPAPDCLFLIQAHSLCEQGPLPGAPDRAPPSIASQACPPAHHMPASISSSAFHRSLGKGRCRAVWMVRLRVDVQIWGGATSSPCSHGAARQGADKSRAGATLPCALFIITLMTPTHLPAICDALEPRVRHGHMYCLRIATRCAQEPQ